MFGLTIDGTKKARFVLEKPDRACTRNEAGWDDALIGFSSV